MSHTARNPLSLANLINSAVGIQEHNRLNSSVENALRISSLGVKSSVDNPKKVSQGQIQAWKSNIAENRAKKLEIEAQDTILAQDETPCKRDLLMLMNTMHLSNRNSRHQSNIYAHEDEHNLKYYKLGKSAQNILNDHQNSLKRELSPHKFRDSSFEKMMLNQRLMNRFDCDERSLTVTNQTLSANHIVHSATETHTLLSNSKVLKLSRSPRGNLIP